MSNLKIEMSGSPKQIAWATAIIAAREKEVPAELRARWEAARDTVTQIGGARFWIDTTSSARGIISAVEAAEKMPKLSGTEKQVAYGKSMRLRKLTEVASQFSGNRLPELLAEMGKETSSKSWIENDAMEMAEKAAENMPEEAPAEQPATTQAEPTKVERIIAKYRYAAELRHIPASEWEAVEQSITAKGEQAWLEAEYAGLDQILEEAKQ